MAAENKILVTEQELESRVLSALSKAGASQASAAAATRAMLHASRLGVDSHGVRLTGHYCTMLGGGRLNKSPQLSVDQRGASSATVTADDGLGHYASYHAVDVGCELAAKTGIAGISVTHSSHFGAAGAYALHGAEKGFVTLATTNADSMVALFDGATRFHGTNPLAIGAPVPRQRPWLLDMATSSIPMNRVRLYQSLGQELPAGVAADANGQPTTSAAAANMLMPVGGVDYGYKGAALAGLATILSAVLSGSTLDADLIPMFDSTDTSTPRNMGHFFLVIDPDKYVGREAFGAAMTLYLASLRQAPAREGGHGVMAPGDREWKVAEERKITGIPIDLDTAHFLGLG
ncbi:MAG TPA: Ldh family oxidoreductase [Devosia sp.]|nr:Ldh family oxidoreductase [Devosia sp.]